MATAGTPSGAAEPRKDFFISYNRTDRAWAEWIAWQLEEAGYTVIVQAWDFRPSTNFKAEMHRALQAATRKAVAELTGSTPMGRLASP